MTKFYAFVGFVLALSTSKTVWDGAYTVNQASRGQAAFAEKCASCHGQNLEGTQGSAVEVDGSPLVGPAFIENWREDDIGELFKFIQSSMPRETASSVSDSDKLDILAFILKSNDFPAGSSELTADAAGKITLVGKDGPKPLPNMTAVRVIGCLTLSGTNSWSLTRASEPGRTRNPAEITPDELKMSANEPLGSLSFLLPKLDVAIPGVKPADLKGHKVEVKGVLYRQTNSEHINGTAISSIAPGCAP